MDTYADDLAALAEQLDLKNAIHVGYSICGGEVTRYIGRHGDKRVSKAVLISAIPPLMLKTQDNPGGLPIDVFDQIRAGVLADRSQFFKDLSMAFYGYNRCIKVFSETDLTEDLKKIGVPTLILRGDDDQIVPIADSAPLSAKLLKNSTLKIYEKFPHGMCTTHAEVVNPDLLAFIKR